MKRSGITRRLALALGVLAAGASSAPAGALAAGIAAPPRHPGAAPRPHPVDAGQVIVELKGLFRVHGSGVTVPDRAVVVSGVVQGYTPRQKVWLVAKLDGRPFRRVLLSIAHRGRHGHFQTTLRAPRPGHVSIKLYHARNRRMLSFERWSSFTALDNQIGPGDRGPMVELVQQKLAALHFFIPQTGVFDEGTELALDAYHRLLGKGEGLTGLDPATLTDLLDGVGKFHVRFPKQGPHAEGDLSDQVLALVDGSKVHWLLPISSGKPSTPTILGSYQIYLRTPGYLPDGMYYSDFFIRGYAIHGYDPAPDYPASHGCMRLPIVDAIPVYDWLKMGDWVDTYYT